MRLPIAFFFVFNNWVKIRCGYFVFCYFHAYRICVAPTMQFNGWLASGMFMIKAAQYALEMKNEKW